MRYNTSSDAISGTTGTPEITTFYYNYETMRLNGIVQATQNLIDATTDGLFYNVKNHGPSTLNIGNIGTSGADNRFEMIYMGESI